MSDSKAGFFDRHYFLLRRLHSLSGIVPVGLFLIIHLTTNSSIVWGEITGRSGAEVFQHEVDFIHSLPALFLVELFGLWLPIGFHAVLGVYYARSGRSNVHRYAYQANWRYTLQRTTGYVGFVFILYHIATLRWGWTWLPLSDVFDGHAAASSTAVAMRGGTEELTWRAGVVGGFYLVGVSMLVYHFANGLWTAAITWGLTVSQTAQKRWGAVCGALGIGLFLAGVIAVVGFLRLDIDATRAIEAGMHGGTPVTVESATGVSSRQALAE